MSGCLASFAFLPFSLPEYLFLFITLSFCLLHHFILAADHFLSVLARLPNSFRSFRWLRIHLCVYMSIRVTGLFLEKLSVFHSIGFRFLSLSDFHQRILEGHAIFSFIIFSYFLSFISFLHYFSLFF